MATNILASLGSPSGLDTKKLVTDLVAAQKAPAQGRIDSKLEKHDAQVSAYGLLKSALTEFQKAVTPLADPNLFQAKSINVPTTDVVSFNSLKAQAPAGNYQIEVEKIAKNQSLAINTTETDANAALGKSGKLTFKTGEWSYDGTGKPDTLTVNPNTPAFDIDISVDDSLTTIAKKINDADSKVQASVLQIDGKFQLLITAEPGVKNALEITTDNTADLSGFEFNKNQNASVEETQKGQDAQFKLNGLPVTRESNTISDVIDGLDFTLNKADAGNTISFSISQDKTSAETAIKGLVEAYNLLQKTMNSLTGVSKNDKNELVRGGLSTDGAAKNLVSLIKQTLTNTVQGLSNTDSYSTLGSVGVNTEKDGTLKIDDEQFNLVIKNDFDKLAGLFGINTTSSSNFIELNTGSFAAQAVAGEYKVDITKAPAKGYISGTSAIDPNMSVGSNSFTIEVNGIKSNSITLSQNYSSSEAMAADLQSLINGDEKLKGANYKVAVTIEGGKLKITSDEYGSSSKINLTAASPDFGAKLGLDATTVGTAGVDAQGTINGVKALGAGNVLLPALGTDAYGLNLTVKEDVVLGEYSVNFTRGLAGGLSLLISSALSENGQISKSESSLEQQKKVLGVDQENLDRKMTAYQQRLSRQYAAMEKIVASLKQTENQLTGLVDRLPFTAKK